MSFGTDVQTERRLRRYPTGPTVSLPTYMHLVETSCCSRTVSSGGALAARWLGLPVEEGQHFSLAAASVSILAHNPSHPDVPVIELWNATPANLLRLLA
jgi:hypothetical protein